MGFCRYTKVCVIGYGKITGEVLKYVYSLKHKYGYIPYYIEHEVHDFNTAVSYCKSNDIAYFKITDKRDLTDFFGNEAENTLIISASNNYIFPEEVVEKENIKIINFHNALLPDFPGRNAPSWAIFEGAKYTGITWHYVNAKVDAGNIICQKRTEISADIKAYELAGILMELAFTAFVECFDSVILDNCVTSVQQIPCNRKMYHSYDIPQKACFDIQDNAADIYRLLRAIDYGKSGIFPSAKTEINGKIVIITRYKIVDLQKAKHEEGYIQLNIYDHKCLQLKYKEI